MVQHLNVFNITEPYISSDLRIFKVDFPPGNINIIRFKKEFISTTGCCSLNITDKCGIVFKQ